MSDLTAIDVLVNPDDPTIGRAKKINERMRLSVPGGFALDATHQPHITTLQRYVRTAQLDQVYDAVASTLAATAMTALSYQAVAIRHTDWGVPAKASPSSSSNPVPRCSTSKRRCSPRSPPTPKQTAPPRRS